MKQIQYEQIGHFSVSYITISYKDLCSQNAFLLFTAAM